MDVEMMMGELKGRLCSSRSLCAITAASGHLLSCLPGDCRCPWQQLLSQSTSAGRRSLKLPAELSCGCPGVGRTRRAALCLRQGRGLGTCCPCLSPHPSVSLSRWHQCLLGSFTPGCWQTDGRCRQIFLLQHSWALRWAEASGFDPGR